MVGSGSHVNRPSRLANPSTHSRLPTSGFRLPALVSVVVVQGVLLALLALIIPGFRFDEPVALVPAAIVITLAQSVVWPVIYGIAVRFGPWLFPIVSFVLTGAMITFAGWLDDQRGVGGVEVADIWTGILVAMGLTQREAVLILYLVCGALGVLAMFITQASLLEGYVIGGAIALTGLLALVKLERVDVRSQTLSLTEESGNESEG